MTEAEAPSTLIPRVGNPEDELRAIKAAATEAPEAQASDNPLANEEFTFHVDWTDGLGQRKTGDFKNRILTIEQRLNVGLLKARLSRNTPWVALDDDTQYLFEMIAHLTESLVEKPAWFKATDMRDVGLLNHVYERVAEHETFFRRSGPTQTTRPV